MLMRGTGVYRCEYDEDEQVYSPAMLEGHGWIGKPDLANAEQRLKKHIYAYVCVFNTIRHLRSLFALGLSLYSSKTDADIVAMVRVSMDSCSVTRGTLLMMRLEGRYNDGMAYVSGSTTTTSPGLDLRAAPASQTLRLGEQGLPTGGQVLRLVQYERIVLLDAGTIVSEGHNIDHLFHLGESVLGSHALVSRLSVRNRCKDAESAAVGVSPTRHGRCQDLPRDPLVRRFVDSSLLLHAKVNFTSCDFCEGMWPMLGARGKRVRT
eukprot:scaffold604_cov384-Prasinococcus_capsulatus_cf.AAC.30